MSYYKKGEGSAVMIRFYKISEVAEMMNLNWMTVYWWCRRGDIPAVHINRTYRIPVKEFKRFLRDRKIKKSPAVAK